MQFIGNIEGYNFKPITNYNTFLNGSASFDRKIEKPEASDFDKIFNMKTSPKTVDPESAGGLMQKIENAISTTLTSVNDNKKAAEAAEKAFAMGEDVSVHDLMIANEKASLSMQMALQTRNKIIAAYTDIKNMAI